MAIAMTKMDLEQLGQCIRKNVFSEIAFWKARGIDCVVINELPTKGYVPTITGHHRYRLHGPELTGMAACPKHGGSVQSSKSKSHPRRFSERATTTALAASPLRAAPEKAPVRPPSSQ
jgi:hypothetical protein